MPTYTEELKKELAFEVVSSTESLASVGEKHGVHYTSLARWAKKYYPDLYDASLKITKNKNKRCKICGGKTSTKYCTDCSSRGWPRIKRLYNLSLVELRSMPTECEVCGSDVNLHIDHDHSTGDYRGVLCSACNVALGQINDNIDILKKLIKYIEKNKKQ